MNKQPRMIDKEKLLASIAEEVAKQEQAKERVGFGHDYWEFHEGAETMLDWIAQEVNSGKFDPDPIPLPTIKRYRCGECKKAESANGWNQETALYFGRTMPQIDEKGEYSDTFVCPACGEGQPRHTIGEVNP